MGRQNLRLLASKPVMDELATKSCLGPFCTELIESGSKVELGKGVSIEFHRVPHRDHGKLVHSIYVYLYVQYHRLLVLS